MSEDIIKIPHETETIRIFNDPSIGDQFSSFSPDDVNGKILLYNAINSPDERLADIINTPIKLRDVVICKVRLVDRPDDDKGVDSNPFTNTEREAFRTILIDEDGKSYTATSTGIYNSVNNLRSVFGSLHFEPALAVKVQRVTVKNGSTLTLNIVSKSTKK